MGDAPWLSKGFCNSPAILICAVIQYSAVRHVGDAMIVPECQYVVPLFEGFGSNYNPVVSVPQRVPASAFQAMKARSSAGSHVSQINTAVKSNPKSEKTSKFKARLERMS